MNELSIHNILREYWGYAQFRPLQQDIIEAVLSGSDTLALLPTSGGKSLCFQVPAMACEGLCLVISPLIALMKDQVQNLKKRGIKAIALHSAMPAHEIDRSLEACAYSKDVKFLYVSPERLQSKLFKERLKKIPVNLVAIDEAHCISQWGYDFRPAYLNIVALRDLLPKGIPFLALTATATERVKLDICAQLKFQKPRIFIKSFQRANLCYTVRKSQAKIKDALKILQKTSGCGIIYARSRRRVQQISDELNRQGIRSDYYHAGLDAQIRSHKQDEWLHDRTRVMVCTNAFGMGIDKPDVRVVIHAEPPDSLEAYYQEAGRAGRDEQKAYAVLLYNEDDLKTLQKNADTGIPPLSTVMQTYQALANYYKIATGAGENNSFDFDFPKFCHQFNLPALPTHQSLKLLAQEGYISLSEATWLSARLHFLYNDQQIYHLYAQQPRLEPYLKAILQNHGGIVYDQYVDIDEEHLARIISKHFTYKTTVEYVKNALKYMRNHHIIDYIPSTNQPQLIFARARADSRNMSFDTEKIAFLQRVSQENVAAMIQYSQNEMRCRSQTLVVYFGENDAGTCGVCDICITQKKAQSSTSIIEQLKSHIQAILPPQGIAISDLIEQLLKDVRFAQSPNFNEEFIVQTVRWLADHHQIEITPDRRLKPIVSS